MAITTTTTTTLLLEQLHDPGASAAWRELDGRYRPIIFGLARRTGFDDETAADLAQETLARFVKAYRSDRYDRTKGRLRSWLLGIARHVMTDAIAERGRRKGWRGASAIGAVPDEPALVEFWDHERRSAILQKALRELRDSSRTSEQTIRAWELVAFHQRDPQAVADELGMTRHDVYVAKHRVTDRLREIVGRTEAAYDEEA